jgi:hypothetical protein
MSFKRFDRVKKVVEVLGSSLKRTRFKLVATGKYMNKSKLSLGLVILAVVMVTGRTFAIPPPPVTAPDAGSSALLMSMGFAGLAIVRKFMR